MTRAATFGLLAVLLAACGLEDPPIAPEPLTPPSNRVEREPEDPGGPSTRVTVGGSGSIGAAARL